MVILTLRQPLNKDQQEELRKGNLRIKTQKFAGFHSIKGHAQLVTLSNACKAQHSTEIAKLTPSASLATLKPRHRRLIVWPLANQSGARAVEGHTPAQGGRAVADRLGRYAQCIFQH
eukprot:540582-Karenia_brevis.AAC.1